MTQPRCQRNNIWPPKQTPFVTTRKRMRLTSMIYVLIAALVISGAPLLHAVCSCACCKRDRAPAARTSNIACWRDQDRPSGDGHPCGCPFQHLSETLSDLARTWDSAQDNEIIKATYVQRRFGSHKPSSVARSRGLGPARLMPPRDRCASLCRFLL